MQGNHWNYKPREAVQVCSITTLYRRKLVPEADLVVIDEAHQSDNESYKWLLEQYKGKFILPVTATPHLKKGMRHVADAVVYPTTFRKLVEDGYLVRPKYYAPTTLDLSDIKVDAKTGDYSLKDLDKKLDGFRLYGDVISHYKELCNGMPAICFAINIRHSLMLCDLFNRAGIPCEHIDANTSISDRQIAYKKLETGDLKVIVNVGVATTGVDIPCLRAIISCRPTKSYNLYIQMCLDSKTEILTKRGFLKYNEIHDFDLVAGFDQKTSEIKWVTIQEKIIRPLYLNEKLYEYKSPHLDFRVTGDHDLLYRAGRNHYIGEWIKEKAEVLSKRKSEYSVPTSGFQDGIGLNLTNEELKFIGLWLADGTIGPSGQLSISQSTGQPWFEGLRYLFKICGFKWREIVFKGDSKFKENYPRIIFNFLRGRESRKGTWGKGGSRKKDGISRLDQFLNKNLSDDFEDLTKEQLGFLLEGLHIGDGLKQPKNVTWTQKSYHISSGNKLFSDRLQSLCVRKGFQCNISTRLYNKNPIYIMHIKDKQQRHIGGNSYKDRSFLKESEKNDNDSLVWCVKNSLGTIITRRNGKVVIMGNCGRGTRPFSGKDVFYVLDHANNILEHGMIEDEQECNLDGTKKDSVKRGKICERCFFVWMPQKPGEPCPECGYINVSPEKGEAKPKLDNEDAKLVEIKSKEDLDHLKIKKHVDRWIDKANDRGYKPGFVFHKTKDKYDEKTAKKFWNYIKAKVELHQDP